GTEIWVSDLTSPGTHPAQDINPGAAGSMPTELTVVRGRLFFAATDPTHGRELWVIKHHIQFPAIPPSGAPHIALGISVSSTVPGTKASSNLALTDPVWTPTRRDLRMLIPSAIPSVVTDMRSQLSTSAGLRTPVSPVLFTVDLKCEIETTR